MKFDSLYTGSTYLVDFKGSCFSHPYNGPVLVTGFNPKGYDRSKGNFVEVLVL